jgi:hypothetical protein
MYGMTGMISSISVPNRFITSDMKHTNNPTDFQMIFRREVTVGLGGVSSRKDGYEGRLDSHPVI